MSQPFHSTVLHPYTPILLRWLHDRTIADGWRGNDTYLGYSGEEGIYQDTLDEVCDQVNKMMEAIGDTVRLNNSMGEFIAAQVKEAIATAG